MAEKKEPINLFLNRDYRYSDYVDAIDRRDWSIHNIERKLISYANTIDVWDFIPSVVELVGSVSSPTIDLTGIGNTQSINKSSPVINALMKEEQIKKMLYDIGKLPKLQKEIILHRFKDKKSINDFYASTNSTSLSNLFVSALESLAIMDEECPYTAYDQLVIEEFENTSEKYVDYDIVKTMVILKVKIHYISEGEIFPEVKNILDLLPDPEKSAMIQRIQCELNEDPLPRKQSDREHFRRAVWGFAWLDDEFLIDKLLIAREILKRGFRAESKRKNNTKYLRDIGIDIKELKDEFTKRFKK